MEVRELKRTQAMRFRALVIFLVGFACVASFQSVCSLSGADAAQKTGKAPWRYIVIHHSGTRKGNASMMDRYHKDRRRMANGLAYHFVIGNGTAACGDGEVEVGNRWRTQIRGGHTKQRWLNESGIGICLVGNFNRQRPTRKQMAALVSLVDRLRKTYGIPLECIKGHGEFRGERTACPGRYFPMSEFKERLKKCSTAGPAPSERRWKYIPFLKKK